MALVFIECGEDVAECCIQNTGADYNQRAVPSAIGRLTE